MAISWVVLSVEPALLRRFGQTVLNVMTRIMGSIVVVIGTLFIIDGVRSAAIDILAEASQR